VAEPVRLACGSEVILFSGSLNTLDSLTFYRTLRVAYEAAGDVLMFNFLCSASLAASEYLTWHRAADVLSFARGLSRDVRVLDDYVAGDCTIAMSKSAAA
jgi:hypothetical protein